MLRAPGRRQLAAYAATALAGLASLGTSYDCTREVELEDEADLGAALPIEAFRYRVRSSTPRGDVVVFLSASSEGPATLRLTLAPDDATPFAEPAAALDVMLDGGANEISLRTLALPPCGDAIEGAPECASFAFTATLELVQGTASHAKLVVHASGDECAIYGKNTDDDFFLELERD